MGSIFINYRRDQTAGEAMALFNQLATTIGKDSVFMDVANIALGRDFRQALHDRLASCDLMLALIGRGWVDATNASGHRRLDDPNDYVRLEISAALKRNIPVLPVLVQGVQMPAMEMLPEEMRDFAFRNAFELSHSRWDSDVHEMLKRLGLGNPQGVGSIPEPDAPVGKASTDGASTAVRGSAAEAGATHPPNRKPWLAIAAGTLAALALAAGGLLYVRTVAERDAKIEQTKIEGARAKAAADAQLLASRAEAAKARADAEAASAAVAAAQSCRGPSGQGQGDRCASAEASHAGPADASEAGNRRFGAHIGCPDFAEDREGTRTRRWRCTGLRRGSEAVPHCRRAGERGRAVFARPDVSVRRRSAKGRSAGVGPVSQERDAG
jgi:hypothetical protein